MMSPDLNGNVGFVSQLVVNGIVAGATYGLVGLGFSLIYSTTRVFHLAHGAVYLAGAYAFYALLRLANLPPVLVVSLVITITALFGLLLELSVYRRLRERHATPRVILIASLGVLIATQNLVSLIFGSDTKVLSSPSQLNDVFIINVRLSSVQTNIIITNIVLGLSVWLFLRFSSFGRNIRATIDDPELTHIVGLPSRRISIIVFAFGSGLAGIAAMLVGFYTDLTPTVGFEIVLMGIVAGIVGGPGNPIGAIWGGFLVGLIQHLSVILVFTKWQRTIVFIVLIAFLILRPQGITGRPVKTT